MPVSFGAGPCRSSGGEITMKHNGKHARHAEEKKAAVAEVVNGRSDHHRPDSIKTMQLGKDCKYCQELRRLQIELVKLQEWIRHEGLRVVVLFEGRDAAGKGGSIKRITETLNPRVCRIVALGTPT